MATLYDVQGHVVELGGRPAGQGQDQHEMANLTSFTRPFIGYPHAEDVALEAAQVQYVPARNAA